MEQEKKKIENHNFFIVSPTLTQTAAKHLEKEIIEGRLKPGTKLIPETLAKRFGVSKSPVREALLGLKEEGLVTLQPRMGFFVAEISLEEIEEIYPIWATLYALVLRMILEKGYEPEFITTVEEFLHKMEERVRVGDLEGYFNQGKNLNDFYLSHCPNRHLRNMVNQLRKKVLKIRFMSLSKIEYARRALSLHRKVGKALKKNDVEATAKAAEETIQSALTDLRKMFAEQV